MVNPLFSGSLGPRFGGVRIIEGESLVDVVEDWSEVRSPARARRRRRKHPQRIKITRTPKPDAFQLPNGTLVMHPLTAAKLYRKLAAVEGADGQ